ncbi:unnamed protein product [Nezara viridula]|uniref:Uncharacterized protein n=1 Tax=Nezara viridula TaxID=85310 RepID=A0A9P0HRB7_NEZVI|nr:unnamed protein product [Nezara viridula]
MEKQAVYGLVSKRGREEERTPADRLGQGDEEDLRGSSLEESSIREERMEKDGTEEYIRKMHPFPKREIPRDLRRERVHRERPLVWVSRNDPGKNKELSRRTRC